MANSYTPLTENAQTFAYGSPQKYGAVSQNDRNFDEKQVPSAPPMEKMDIIPGYETINIKQSEQTFAPPPSYEAVLEAEEQQRRATIVQLPSVTSEEARQALLREVTKHCCWGSSAAKNLTIREIIQSTAFHLTLETFGESRSTSWAFEPFRGQPIDSPNMGQAPEAWDIFCITKQAFVSEEKQMEVPHTASVKMCHCCGGAGRRQCSSCFGRGQETCNFCNGTGSSQSGSHHHHHDDQHHHGHHHHVHHHQPHHHENRCTWCNGSGWRHCHKCNGAGTQVCHTCDGACSLKFFIKLTVKFTNHIDDFIYQKSNLPGELVRDVTGRQVVGETASRVFPLTHFPIPELAQASHQLVEKHSSSWCNTERIVAQRQTVRAIPVAEAFYTWEKTNSTKSFFVYGFENSAYAPDYPQQCCYGCAIL